MGKRLIQAATITCMLYVIVAIGSSSKAQTLAKANIQPLTDESGLLLAALRAVLQ